MSVRRKTERLTWSAKTGKAITHGTAAGYSRDGCRCDECYGAVAAWPSRIRDQELRRACGDSAASA